MKYKVHITEIAIKDINKLELKTKKRILSKLDYFSNDPIKHSIKLKDSEGSFFRFRVGDYRIIFEIKNNVIVVLRIGDRKDIYN